MLKKFQDLGFDFVKPVNKESNESVKTALYAINDLVYQYRGMYASPNMVCELERRIGDIGTELKSAECPARCAPKRDEVLQSMRNMLRGFIQYRKEHPYLQDDDWDQVSKVMNYFVQKYVKAKPQINSGEEAIKWLGQWQEIATYYLQPYNTKYNLKVFYDIGEELLKIIKNCYNPFKSEIYNAKASGSTPCDYALFWMR